MGYLVAINLMQISEQSKEKILSVGESKSNIQNTYYLEGNDLIYERGLSEIYSDKKTKIEDFQKI